MHAQSKSFDRLAIIKCRLREGLLIFLLCLMGVVFDGVVFDGLVWLGFGRDWWVWPVSWNWFSKSWNLCMCL